MSAPGPYDQFAAPLGLEGVPSAYAAVRDGIDSLLRDRGLRRTTPDDTAASLLAGALASAGLEGVEPDADAVRAHGVTADTDPVTAGAVRLSAQLLGLVPTWRSAPLQALARMHSLASSGLVAAGALGADEVGRPTHPEGAGRLGELARALGRGTEAPALVVAALVHAEVASAAAFGSLDGMVARAAERLVLVATGVDPASVIVPEAGHAAEPDGYRAALAAYARDDRAGLQQWLQYASQALARGAEASPLDPPRGPRRRAT